MFSKRPVESDLRRKVSARSKVSRLALIVAGALAFTVSGHLAFGAENRNGQASGASSASALSMTDQEVAATMSRLGLELSSKPSIGRSRRRRLSSRRVRRSGFRG